MGMIPVARWATLRSTECIRCDGQDDGTVAYDEGTQGHAGIAIEIPPQFTISDSRDAWNVEE